MNAPDRMNFGIFMAPFHRIGDNHLPSSEVLPRQCHGNSVTGGPDLASQHIRRSNRLLDGVDPSIERRTPSGDLPGNGRFARSGQSSKYYKHRIGEPRGEGCV